MNGGINPRSINHSYAINDKQKEFLLIEQRNGKIVKVPISLFDKTTNQVGAISDTRVPYWDNAAGEWKDSNATSDGTNMTITGGEVRLPDGADRDPVITFDNDRDTGIFRKGADDIGISVNGAETFHIDSSNGVFQGGIQTKDGDKDNVAHSFESDPNSGLFLDKADTPAISAGGSRMAYTDGTNFYFDTPISLDGGTTTIGSTEINLLDGMTAKSGADSTFMTGTAGSNGNLAEFNADGDIVDTGTATSNVLTDVVDDTSPQLGGNLDINGNLIQDTNGNELLDFTATASAVNHFQIVNAATGDGSEIQSVGGDTNIDMVLTPKGSGIIQSTADLSLDGGTTTISSSEINLLDGMSSKTGADTNFVTGTSGTGGNVVEWNADGDIVDTGIASSDVVTPSSTDTFTNKTFDANGTGNTLSNVETGDFASSALTGADTQVVTGTSGTSGNFLEWNADGDAIDSGKASPSGDVVGTTDTQTLTNKTIDGGTFATSMSINDAVNISVGTTNGTQIATSETQKLGFFGATPVVRPSAPASLTNNMSATSTDDALESIGDTSAGDVSPAIERNLTELKDEIDTIRTLIIDLGIGA